MATSLLTLSDRIATFFHKMIFGMISTVSRIVDVLINFIRIILGLDPLTTNENISISLYDNLIAQNVMQAFGICVFAGFMISVVFALVRFIKSHITEREEEGVGVWKALRGLAVNVASYLVIPIFAVSIVLATGAVAKTVDNATRDGNAVGVSYSAEVIFSTVDYDMLEDKGKDWYKGINDCQIYDKNNRQITGMTAVKLVYSGWERGSGIYHADGSEYNYSDTGLSGESPFEILTTLVDEDAYFDMFILPMLGSCVMLVALAMSSITIAQRLFSVVFLFILSPLPASFRPYDDGARFKKWAEIFIGKVLSGFGIVFALNVFFSLAPEFTKYEFFSGSFANGCAKLIIYIAGVSFAMGANLLVSQFIGGDSLSAERDQTTQNFRAAMSGAHLAGAMTRSAGRMTKFAFGHSGTRTGGGRALAAQGAASGAAGGRGEVSQAIGSRMEQKPALGENTAMSSSSAAAQGAGVGSAAAPMSASHSANKGSNGAATARQIGGGLGEAGYNLMGGHAGKAAGNAAKSAGSAIGMSRIGRAVAGTAMFAAGAVTYAARSVGKGARSIWYNTAGRGTAGAERYRAARATAKAARAQAKEERGITKASERQTKFENAAPEKKKQLIAKSQKAAEKENARRMAKKKPLNVQKGEAEQAKPARELRSRDLGKKE